MFRHKGIVAEKIIVENPPINDKNDKMLNTSLLFSILSVDKKKYCPDKTLLFSTKKS